MSDSRPTEASRSAVQEKWLYVFDPTALRSIVLKEQGTYDQIPWLIECVSRPLPFSSDHF